MRTRDEYAQMSEESQQAAKIDILHTELENLIGYQADRVSNLNERTGWLLVFSALNVSTLMVSSFAAFRSHLTGESSRYEWWLYLFALDILLYLLVIVLGFLGQRIVIRFVDVETEDEAAYKELLSHDVTYLKEWLLQTLSVVFRDNERLVNRKTQYLNYAYGFLVIAVALLFMVVLTAMIL
jgi:hypothetical protein